METVETVLSGFYLYIAHDLNRGLCKLPAKKLWPLFYRIYQAGA